MGNSIGLKGWSSVINGALILRPLNRVKLHLYLPTPPSPLKLHILVPFPFEPPLREGNGRVEKRGTRWGGGCRGLGRSNRRGRLGLRFRIRIGRGCLRGSSRGFGALLWSRGCRPRRWLLWFLGALTLMPVWLLWFSWDLLCVRKLTLEDQIEILVDLLHSNLFYFILLRNNVVLIWFLYTSLSKKLVKKNNFVIFSVLPKVISLAVLRIEQ